MGVIFTISILCMKSECLFLLLLFVFVVVVYSFFCGMRSSMEPSCSRRFSISMRRATPSMTPWTNSTSENPKRSELERSKIPPSAAVSTPPVPRFCLMKKKKSERKCK